MASSPKDVDLVTVLETTDTFALTEAKATLDDAGIPYVVQTPDFGFLPGWHGTAQIGSLPLNWMVHSAIQVARESEEEARALLENFRTPSSEQEPE